MIRCPKCHKELEDGSKFCDACGARIYETIYCPNCGEPSTTEFAFCQKCGASLKEDAALPVPFPKPAVSIQPRQPEQKPARRAFPGKLLALGGIGIIAVAAVILVVTTLLSGGDSSYSLYFKDGEIFYTDYTEDGTRGLTSRFIDIYGLGELLGSEMVGEELASSAGSIGMYITSNASGSRIFFPDRLNEGIAGIPLYYRDVDKPKEEPVKVDSDVVQYAINDEGTRIVYIQGSDGVLYTSDLEEKERIASGAVSFYVTDDLSKVGYLDSENSFYLWSEGEEPVKLAGGIEDLKYVSPDLSVIYYMKEGGLYKQAENSEDPEKIASDISTVVQIYDTGEIYFTQINPSEYNLMDFVEDDMAAADAAVTEPDSLDYPDAPDFPSLPDYDSTEAYDAAVAQYQIDYENYQAAYRQANSDYDAAYRAYREKQDRDSLREELADFTLDSRESTLYYYDGSELSVVSDTLATSWNINCAEDKPAAVFPVYSQTELPKVKLSEIDSTSDVVEMVYSTFYDSSERCVAQGDSTSLLEQTDAIDFIFTPDGGTLYFLDEVSATEEGSVYKSAIKNGQAGKPELVDSGVYINPLFVIAGDKLVYYKNVNSDGTQGDLYISGEKIDSDVYLWSPTDLDGAVLYSTDWNSDRGMGTLKLFDKGTSTKISDDVSNYEITDSGDIIYMYDYSLNTYTGTLYQYHKGESEKIDDEVTALILMDDSRVRGGNT